MEGPLWTSDEAVAATGGRTTRPWAATGVSIDSRTLAEGDLFVAIQGPNFDGHDFVADALAKGAAAAVVARRPETVAEDTPLLLVDETLPALRALAAAARARSMARVIAVTGSVGKTSVKTALARVLAEQGATHASLASLNNHWGVPLSLARLPRDARFAVFELGMNHPGEIDPLSRLVRPHVAVITTIAPAHIEFFPSLDAIADAKAEIFAGLAAGGPAVLNTDIPQFARLKSAAERAGADVVGFGHASEARARVVSADLRADRSAVRLDLAGKAVSFTVGAPGPHWVMNAACVLASVHAAGGDALAAAAEMASLAAPAGRGRMENVTLECGTLRLIDDSYNANPASMRAAFDVLGRSPVGAGGRRIAVLGDMLELGTHAETEHAGLAEPVTSAEIDLVFTCGAMMRRLHDALPAERRGGHAADAAALAPVIASAVRGGDAVMVKGSAGSRMGTIVHALKSLDQASGWDARQQRAADGA